MYLEYSDRARNRVREMLRGPMRGRSLGDEMVMHIR